MSTDHTSLQPTAKHTPSDLSQESSMAAEQQTDTPPMPIQHSVEVSAHVQTYPSARQDALFIIRLLLRERLFIGYTTLGCGLIAALISFAFLSNWYSSTTNLVPPKRSSNMLDGIMGGLSSTLKDIGLSKMGGGKGGTDSYTHLVILQSRRLKDTVIQLFHLPDVYGIAPHKMTELREEFDANVKIEVGTEGNYMVSVLHTDAQQAANMANTIVAIGNQYANEIFQMESIENRRITEQRYNQNEEKLLQSRDTLKHFSSRYKIFSPTDQAKAASTSLADIRSERIRQEMALEVMKNTYGSNDPATQMQRKQIENIRAKENEVENQPGFIGNFAIAQGSEVMIEYMRLYTDVEVYSKVKAFLVPMLEQAKLDEQRILPAMYILDPAIPADKKAKPKRSLIILGAVFGGFIFACAIVILRRRMTGVQTTLQMMIAEADAPHTDTSARLSTIITQPLRRRTNDKQE
jgi:tyrosine-protein kinase Etk/Wzc